MIRDLYTPRPLAPSERKCIDLAAALAARVVLHYAERLGRFGQPRPGRLDVLLVRRSELAATVADCERRYPRPAPPAPPVTALPAAVRAPAVVSAVAASVLAAAPSRPAASLAAATPVVTWVAEADDDDDDSYSSSYYSDDDTSHSVSASWYPDFNVNGLPMIQGSCVDVHGHVYGDPTW